ncbi:DNA-directed RNA polymerase subunit omega [candidate division WOR-1 bacterium RIFOXYA12_FULL_43_27]|uniref:DNA-directed RNA polymerase subunit omega n=1 Tax=candidate division WOR-1 bacterium RIFOXYC2_FULL_46_14 TaxID=1802587 RepID=A0A1F4U4W2_UNCSA|nr:MAG: DNA-directed RNA polymerase subunit omega [candidate division WOR-1 bacterium RIFOXYA12_FULL_43_27]OGC20729.1 MAG: DNA-directed RNA polymerase subunit omega [candidate division WOR-1 bacterium RIFOXYB2_FULL_46_45]OGC31534.1 MAG: DNA-directed RNA polymerase subunit omega [candidate division WOR-1 bacterium RIFOXYA2_FULL_46_56]OGC39941.1 MAG: DNA-directed RNA polymerase subunit omega [candidate division WOR-1 bacterium RIFOXYC2_FULL_46_14]
MRESVDGLLGKAKNKFLLVNAVSERAKQITAGSLPYINDFDPSNPIVTAIREIWANKINIKLESAPKKQKPEELLLKEEPQEEPKKRANALDRLAKHSKGKSKKNADR